MANLTLGSHVVEFRKKLLRDRAQRTLEVPEPRDYDPEPVRLEESLGLAAPALRSARGAHLHRRRGHGPDARASSTASARAGTASRSSTPAGQVRPGRDAGARTRRCTLDCPIRPSLAFLGVVAESAAGERVVAEVEEKLSQNLARMTSLNFIPPRARRSTASWRPSSSRAGAWCPAPGTDADLVRKVTEKLAAALEVQGFLIGRAARGAPAAHGRPAPAGGGQHRAPTPGT